MEAVLTEPKVQIMIEEHIVLSGVSWMVYEQLMKDHENRSAPGFIYDQGDLEIYLPSQKHEEKSVFLEKIVEIIAEEQEVEVRNIVYKPCSESRLEAAMNSDYNSLAASRQDSIPSSNSVRPLINV